MKSIRLLTVAILSLGLFVVTPGAQAGGGCHTATGAAATSARAEGDEVEVKVEKCMYGPTVMYVDEGTKVSWTNADPLPHSVTGALLAWGDTELLDRGESLSYRFEDEGVYPYYCVLHPGMAAAVVVGDPGPETASVAPLAQVEPPAAPSDAQPEKREAQRSTSVHPLLVVGPVLLAGAAFALVRRRRPGAPVSA